MKRSIVFVAALAVIGFSTTPCKADANVIHVAGLEISIRFSTSSAVPWSNLERLKMKMRFLLTIPFLSFVAFGQEPVFTVGTNTVSIVFSDANASQVSKTLFLSDFAKAAAASEKGLSISVTTNAWHPAFVYPQGPTINVRLDGIQAPKFMNGDTGFPSSLHWTNGVWALFVSKEYTDGFATLCAFAEAHSNELAKLRTFVTNDLAAERLATLSDDDIYEMYLSKQWTPGDRTGPSLLPESDRPQIIRGIYYEPPIAAVLSWPMGPSEAPEHLWAQINVRADGRIYETRAIYFRDQWWLTVWDWEEGDPVWNP